MKRLLPALCAALATLSTAIAAPVFQPGDLLAVCGDSITEQRIYSVFIEDYLRMCLPAGDVRVVQFGVGGERAAGLLARMRDDVLTFSPNVATLCYGMNDGNYRAVTPEVEATYRANLAEVVKGLKAGGVRGVIVGSPGVVDSVTFARASAKTPSEVYNATLARLGEIGREVAAGEGVAFADLHTVLMDVMAKAKAAKGARYNICGIDGIHPGQNGHLVMAYVFLKAMGFDGQIATITHDLQTGQTTATAGQSVVASAPGKIQLESTVFPFCFTGRPEGTGGDTAEVLAFLPFNAELNRYTLVVKGLRSPRAKVTWGKAAREFGAEELAAGVNLADAFLENPFVLPFRAVEKQVRLKQEFETAFIKNFLTPAPKWVEAIPGSKENFAALDAQYRAIHQTVSRLADESKKPVGHVILIEPLP